MKKIILVFAITGTLASCGNGNQQAVDQANKTADSLKDAMARQQTIDSMNQANGQPQQATTTATQVTTTEHHTEYRDHENRDHENRESNYQNGGAPVSAAPAGGGVVSAAPAGGGVVNNTTTTTTTTAATTTAPAKKGWSAKADGALIGAGAGAVTGALLDSKKKGQAVKGGVIGGVLGAAAGLGAGAIIDKDKKDKQAAANSNGQ